MHTLLVATHVVAMISSVALMTIAVGLGLSGKKSSVRIATVGFVASLTGAAMGLMLLLDSVLSFECAMLTLYLAAVVTLYHYGFASGNVNKARIVRQFN